MLKRSATSAGLGIGRDQSIYKIIATAWRPPLSKKLPAASNLGLFSEVVFSKAALFYMTLHADRDATMLRALNDVLFSVSLAKQLKVT